MIPADVAKLKPAEVTVLMWERVWGLLAEYWASSTGSPYAFSVAAPDHLSFVRDAAGLKEFLGQLKLIACPH